MNRRGFLGAVAGALVAGKFARLAPAPPPLAPAVLAAAPAFEPYEFRFYAYAQLMAMRPGHRYIIGLNNV